MFHTLPPLQPQTTPFNFTTYTPHHPSPLSSSPLKPSPSPTPSPLGPRDGNIPSMRNHNTVDMDLTSPTPSPSKRFSAKNGNGPSQSQAQTSPPQSPSQLQPQLQPQYHTRRIHNLPSPPPSHGKESVYSKRVTKANPLLNKSSNSEDGRETRRKLFLKRVREGAEEKRWERRGGDEEILRMLWVGEERERRSREMRDTQGMEMEAEELSLDEVMADEVAMEEEAELEAMLGNLHQEKNIPSPINTPFWGNGGRQIQSMHIDTHSGRREKQRERDPETPYGSDDEEYDHIFMDVIQEESRMASQSSSQALLQQQQHQLGYLEETDHEMMDMS